MPGETRRPSSQPAIDRPAQGDTRTTHTEVSVEAWQGPLPPPAVLEKYKQIISDGPERVFKQWEKETAHRHEMETRQQTLPFWDRVLARSTALAFAAGCLAVIAYAVSAGQQWVAVTLSGAMIIAGINAFIRRS